MFLILRRAFFRDVSKTKLSRQNENSQRPRNWFTLSDPVNSLPICTWHYYISPNYYVYSICLGLNYKTSWHIPYSSYFCWVNVVYLYPLIVDWCIFVTSISPQLLWAPCPPPPSPTVQNVYNCDADMKVFQKHQIKFL